MIKSSEVATLPRNWPVSGSEYELNSQALSQTLVDVLLSNLEHGRGLHKINRGDRYQWPLFAYILPRHVPHHPPRPRRQLRTAPAGESSEHRTGHLRCLRVQSAAAR